MSKSNSTLTIERLREVLNYCPETGLFTWKICTSFRVRVGSIAGYLDSKGYIFIRIDKRLYSAHRLAFFWANGETSKTQAIDHIDRNPANNKWANLREVTHGENSQNTGLSSRNSSGHKGVSWEPENGKWRAYIALQNKFIGLGRFSNLSDAIAARKAAEIVHHPFRATGPSTFPSCSS